MSQFPAYPAHPAPPLGTCNNKPSHAEALLATCLHVGSSTSHGLPSAEKGSKMQLRPRQEFVSSSPASLVATCACLGRGCLCCITNASCLPLYAYFCQQLLLLLKAMLANTRPMHDMTHANLRYHTDDDHVAACIRAGIVSLCLAQCCSALLWLQTQLASPIAKASTR